MSHSRFLPIAAVLLSIALPSTLAAQAVDTATGGRGYQLFGGYSFLSNSFNGHDSATSHQPLNGWDVAFSAGASRGLSVKVDASGYYGTSLGSPQHPIFVLGGAQYSRPFGRESAFVEGLAGVGHLNSDWWGGEIPGHTFSFAGVAGGGLDRQITPRISFRLEGDLLYANFTIPDNQIHGLPNYFARISTGLVWRF